MKHLFFIYSARAKEKHIADDIDFSRMINTSNIEESFKVLQDTNYAPYSLNKKAIEYESVIEEEKKEFINELLKMGAKGEILEILSIKKENFFKVLKKIESKKVLFFLKEYGSLLKEFNNFLKGKKMEEAKKIEKEMEKKEEEFISKSEVECEGLSPFFAFILKKSKAEKKVKIILASKKLGISIEEINELVSSVRAI